MTEKTQQTMERFMQDYDGFMGILRKERIDIQRDDRLKLFDIFIRCRKGYMPLKDKNAERIQAIEILKADTRKSTIDTLDFLYKDEKEITVDQVAQCLGCTDKAVRTRLKNVGIDVKKGAVLYKPEKLTEEKLFTVDADNF